MTNYIETFIESPVVSRIRRNHGLEHATIHILSKKFPGARLIGHSDARGFWLVGDLTTEPGQGAPDIDLHPLPQDIFNVT